MRRTTVWILQATSRWDCLREDLYIATKGTPQKRNWISWEHQKTMLTNSYTHKPESVIENETYKILWLMRYKSIIRSRSESRPKKKELVRGPQREYERKRQDRYILGWLVGRVYGISIFVGYLIPNQFLNK